MKVAEIYSHLNGLEFLLVHKPALWDELQASMPSPPTAPTAQMSSGVAYYEGELYNVVRQGRGVPAVPLVIVGVCA